MKSSVPKYRLTILPPLGPGAGIYIPYKRSNVCRLTGSQLGNYGLTAEIHRSLMSREAQGHLEGAARCTKQYTLTLLLVQTEHTDQSDRQRVCSKEDLSPDLRSLCRSLFGSMDHLTLVYETLSSYNLEITQSLAFSV